MRRAAPAPKIHEIAERLGIQFGLDRPNELELFRLSSEADNLIKSCGLGADALADAYSLKGAAAFLLRKDAEGREFFEKAFKISASRMHRMNYVRMLRRRGYMTEAFEVADSLAVTYRDDIAMLKTAAGAAAVCLQADRFHAHRTALMMLGVDPSAGDSTEGNISNAEGFKRFFERVLTRPGGSARLFELVEAAGGVVRDRFGVVDGYGIDVTDDGEVAMHFCVHGTADEAVAASFAIADTIVAKFEDPLMDLVTIGCLPRQ